MLKKKTERNYNFELRLWSKKLKNKKIAWICFNERNSIFIQNRLCILLLLLLLFTQQGK